MKVILSIFIFAFPVTAYTDVFRVSVPGYEAEVGEHKVHASQKDIVVISLHGKEKGREHESNIAFANELASHGYVTYTPQMPWHAYSAPLQTTYTFLDALIEKVAKGRKVVIAGHSQGASYALFYLTDHQPPSNVVGNVLLAPGHLVHRSSVLRQTTKSSVLLAKKMVTHGRKDDSEWFYDFNGGGGIGYKEVLTTPAIYLSYFDPDTSPNFEDLIMMTDLPLLWVDGESDELSQRMDYPGIYASANSHPKNKYAVVSGGHISMWENAVDSVIKWISELK